MDDMIKLILFCITGAIVGLIAEFLVIPYGLLKWPQLIIQIACILLEIYWLRNYLKHGNIHGKRD